MSYLGRKRNYQLGIFENINLSDNLEPAERAVVVHVEALPVLLSKTKKGFPLFFHVTLKKHGEKVSEVRAAHEYF